MSRLTPAVALPGLAVALLAGALAVEPGSAPAAEMTSVRLVAVAHPSAPARSPEDDDGGIGQADGSSKSDRSDLGLNGSGTRNARDSREDAATEDDNLSGWFDWMRNTPAPNSGNAGSSGGGSDKAEKKDDEQRNIQDGGGSWIEKLLDSIFSGIAKALG